MNFQFCAWIIYLRKVLGRVVKIIGKSVLVKVLCSNKYKNDIFNSTLLLLIPAVIISIKAKTKNSKKWQNIKKKSKSLKKKLPPHISNLSSKRYESSSQEDQVKTMNQMKNCKKFGEKHENLFKTDYSNDASIRKKLQFYQQYEVKLQQKKDEFFFKMLQQLKKTSSNEKMQSKTISNTTKKISQQFQSKQHKKQK